MVAIKCMQCDLYDIAVSWERLDGPEDWNCPAFVIDLLHLVVCEMMACPTVAKDKPGLLAANRSFQLVMLHQLSLVKSLCGKRLQPQVNQAVVCMKCLGDSAGEGDDASCEMAPCAHCEIHLKEILISSSQNKQQVLFWSVASRALPVRYFLHDQIFRPTALRLRWRQWWISTSLWTVCLLTLQRLCGEVV